MNTLIFILGFYYGFALCIGVYRRWVQGSLNVWNKVAFCLPILVFATLDVVLNYTVVSIVMGLPPKGDYSISDRFETYHKTDEGWKTTVATFVCEKLLNPIDPTGNHC